MAEAESEKEEMVEAKAEDSIVATAAVPLALLPMIKSTGNTA